MALTQGFKNLLVVVAVVAVVGGGGTFAHKKNYFGLLDDKAPTASGSTEAAFNPNPAPLPAPEKNVELPVTEAAPQPQPQAEAPAEPKSNDSTIGKLKDLNNL